MTTSATSAVTNEKKPKKYSPWLSQEERRIMILLRDDLRRQAQRTDDPTRRRELEQNVTTLSRELAFDKENR